MKRKYFLFLFIAPFVSGCENTHSPNPYELIIDSTVNAKLTEHRAKLVSKNDSILTALENAQADSLAKNGSGSKKYKNTQPVNDSGKH